MTEPVRHLEQNEQALIERIKNGEQDLFYELIRPHERSVFMAAFAILQNQADAEEIAQEAILKAFIHLRDFRSEAKFSTWLIQITVNEARMRRRRDHKDIMIPMDQPQNEEGEYTPKAFADWREIPSEALERKEVRDALAKALALLPDKYREVFILRDVRNFSIAETSQALGISVAAVKSRLLAYRCVISWPPG